MRRGADLLCPSPRRGKILRLRSIFCAPRHELSHVMLLSKVWVGVVYQRVLPYITAIGIGIAAASALSFFSLVSASGIRFDLMH